MIDSTVNNEGGRGEEIDDDFAPLDEEGWLMYSGGKKTQKIFEGEIPSQETVNLIR